MSADPGEPRSQARTLSGAQSNPSQQNCAQRLSVISAELEPLSRLSETSKNKADWLERLGIAGSCWVQFRHLDLSETGWRCGHDCDHRSLRRIPW